MISLNDTEMGRRFGFSNIILCLLMLSVLILLAGCGGTGAGSEPAVSLASGNLILDDTHADGAAWALPDCSACHALSAIHDRADRIRAIAKDKGYAGCAGCHGRNGTDTPRRCILCHNATDLPTAPHQQGEFTHHFTSGVAGSLDDDNCLSCHDASDMDGVFELNQDLTRYPGLGQLVTPYSALSDFCLRCHNRDHQQPGYEMTDTAFDDPLIAIEEAFNLVDKHGRVDGLGTRTYAGLRNNYRYGSEVDCSDCHAMHGTRNRALIVDNTSKGLSLLEVEQGVSITVTGTDFSQLCVVCHQMSVILDGGAIDSGNGLSGVHQVGGDCLVCHSHGEAVQAGL